MINAKPYEEFEGKFCKVIIRTTNGEKALKGIVHTFEQHVSIKGDYQETTVHISLVLRITTKESDADGSRLR